MKIFTCGSRPTRRAPESYFTGLVHQDPIHEAEAPARIEKRPAVLPMWQQEQRIIEDAIASFGGNVSLAAAALEISPSTIYRKRQGWAEMAAAS